MRQAEVERARGAHLARTIGPTTQEQLPIVQPHVQQDARRDLKGEPRADPGNTAPAVEPPFVAVDRAAERRRKIGRQARDARQVQAQLRTQLLQYGQAQEVGRILPGELVRTAQIPRPPRAIAHANREAATVPQDTRQIIGAPGTNLPRRGHRFTR